MNTLVKGTMLMGMLLFGGLVNAQYSSFYSDEESFTVKQVLEQASRLDKVDATVKIKGCIYKRVKDDTFWFRDETGKILIEIDRENFPPFGFDDRTPVYVIGEVDYDLLDGTEIEVEKIQLAR